MSSSKSNNQVGFVLPNNGNNTLLNQFRPIEREESEEFTARSAIKPTRIPEKANLLAKSTRHDKRNSHVIVSLVPLTSVWLESGFDLESPSSPSTSYEYNRRDLSPPSHLIQRTVLSPVFKKSSSTDCKCNIYHFYMNYNCHR